MRLVFAVTMNPCAAYYSLHRPVAPMAIWYTCKKLFWLPGSTMQLMRMRWPAASPAGSTARIKTDV